ncbi:hypothetical protein GDO81_007640 [Engystomops pustulosus]|uniref:Uncharacterized protein n=1 Tax=Engystomops pustulosus TaxID=76066 RepID=A0AAV7C8I4_ENGPU|nr:hypothetical protein GDO81_007640 [Engystomops pustulosus]
MNCLDMEGPSDVWPLLSLLPAHTRQDLWGMLLCAVPSNSLDIPRVNTLHKPQELQIRPWKSPQPPLPLADIAALQYTNCVQI